MSHQVARRADSRGGGHLTGPGILHGPAVRGALALGVETMVATVRPTLGPLPRTVAVLDVDSGRPVEVLDDAATILRRTIELPDPYVNMGAMMLRHAVWQTYEAVGDGGATTAVLLQAILRELSPYVAAGGDPVALRRHLECALATATDALTRQSRPLHGPDEIARAALTISHDPELAKMLGEILDIIGPDGCLLIENAYGSGLSRQYVEGVHWNEGYRSPYFVTDEDKQEVRLDNPAILISDLRLTDANELVPLLDSLVAAHCPGLLVIADEISGDALSLLLANHRQGTLRSVAVRAPSQTSTRARILEDLAVLTGGRVVTAEGGERAADLTLADLGHATHVWANSGNFGVYGGNSDPMLLRRRIAEVRAELAATDKPDEREQVRQRLGKLMGGVAVLYVGGDTEREQGARKALALRTVTALRLALDAGVAPGGGAAYLGCQEALRAPRTSVDESVAFQALAAALEEPLAVLAGNAGFEPSAIAAQVRAHAVWGGFDVLTGRVVNMWDAGIVDPVPVLRKALEVAVSGAIMTLISSVLVHKRTPLAVAKP
ncbi:MAG: 60 kDa chaperonin [Chloroflexi bacterium]|nr:60 kDa chaperonin [Chloroflexota bacterium]